MAKEKILLVEDEEDMAYALEMQLDNAGFEVIKAVDGKEGLDKARSQNPDLIILDLMLPKLDGYRVCRMLKFDAKYEKIPIIFLTARAQKEDLRTGIEVGADAYLNKSCRPEVLIDKIKVLLKQAKRGG